MNDKTWGHFVTDSNKEFVYNFDTNNIYIVIDDKDMDFFVKTCTESLNGIEYDKKQYWLIDDLMTTTSLKIKKTLKQVKQTLMYLVEQ